ncbi:nucleotidyltransferase family protein [Kaistella antarctica]|uniref:Glucose-1-phosphate cytidylyltransferase n=1 Tax=Kaistella antarctica TaxID=266748 RepID=A0A3S4WSN5_9FLAO|nr:nucleotidyltransferase family protein [Kaistella antarctica]KEY18817.1 nucleotidyltransferase [Kaistella antarctica]SEW15090.1 CBS domain-containing protein [Kaistella antarctica]VEH99442.1 Glucose-1-phosphate cytidylyltransferase [Kaistella antarctica]
MRNFREHLVFSGSSIKEALIRLDILSEDAILFVVDKDDKLIGSLTDGDVRRALIKEVTIEKKVDTIIQENPKFIRKGDQDIQKIIEYREGNFRILPVIDSEDKVVNVINFREIRSYLPIDVVIMAGGRGKRLQPLTDTTPKPLLKVGGKAIMEHNVDRLALYGIDDFWFAVKYLGEQIESFFGNGSERNLAINYVWEDTALGTIGAVSKIDNFAHDYVLVTNSDVLTNIDYEDLFLDFFEKDADFSVVTIPYQVNIPYAVLETHAGQIKSFKEKPTYTYYSNGGIYLMKKSVLEHLPKEKFFDATDLIAKLISENLKVISYPLVGYWLDIGKHEDFKKAQEDIKQIKF